MLPIPDYLRAAPIQDASVRYEWDDWRTPPALKEPDASVVEPARRLSHRAVFAFSCGSAEWLVYRFAPFLEDNAPWDYIEAAWAMIVDVRYSGYGDSIGWQEYSMRGWDGPVKRPIRNCLRYLDIEFEQLTLSHQSDPAVYGGLISALTTYVMPDPIPYRSWCEKVLERFSALYLRTPEDPLGDVVPREAINPGVRFHVEDTERLVNEFLSGLDYRSNVFLSTPAGMTEQFEGEPDFVGTPYRFDIELDRLVRRQRSSAEHRLPD